MSNVIDMDSYKPHLVIQNMETGNAHVISVEAVRQMAIGNLADIEEFTETEIRELIAMLASYVIDRINQNEN